MGIKELYLIAYNLGCLLGWGGALALGLQSLAATQGDLASAWSAMAPTIVYVQLAMALEIMHAFLRLVKSPFFVTFLQVTSRLFLVAVILAAPEAS